MGRKSRALCICGKMAAVTKSGLYPHGDPSDPDGRRMCPYKRLRGSKPEATKRRRFFRLRRRNT